MCSGGFEEGKVCLCVKIDMVLLFIVMCDLVLYCIKFVEYYQIGNKWCIYLMYDFIYCISDVLEGIIYLLCILEFQDNCCLYDWVLDNISILVYLCQYEFLCLNFEYIVMFKCKLNQFVIEKYVEGWDDLCMLIIFGLCCCGYIVEFICEFCKCIGVIKQDNIIEMVLLEFCICEDLNENVLCVMVVIDLVKLVIENYLQGESEMVVMLNYLNKLEMGSCEVLFSVEIWIDCVDFCEEVNKQYKCLVLGKEVCLCNVYVIKVECVEKDVEGNIIIIFCIYDVDILSKDLVDGCKVKGVIYWVSVVYVLLVEICFYDCLFSVLNLGVVDDFFVVINLELLVIKQGYVELSLVQVEVGKVYQFECEGYFCFDSCYVIVINLVFNCIVGLCDIWVKVGE